LFKESGLLCFKTRLGDQGTLPSSSRGSKFSSITEFFRSPRTSGGGRRQPINEKHKSRAGWYLTCCDVYRSAGLPVDCISPGQTVMSQENSAVLARFSMFLYILPFVLCCVGGLLVCPSSVSDRGKPAISNVAMADDAFDLEMELLCLPASGSSVRQMHRLCEKIAKACGHVPQHIEELANLPADSHRERDLHRWVKRQPWRAVAPEAYEFELPYTADGIWETTVLHSAFLPHEFLSNLFNFPELFDELLCGEPGSLTSFWEHTAAMDPEWYARHPVQALHDDPGICIPCGIHGDDSGLYQSDKMLVISWGSVVRQLLTLDSRLLFAAVTYAHVVYGKTVETLYKVLAWSFNCMADGTFPSHDHNGREFTPAYQPKRFARAGQPLTQYGHRGLLAEIRGDWKWQVEAFNHQQHYGTKYICHLCRAHTNIPRLLYTHFKRTDQVRNTRVRHHQWRDWHGDRERPALSQIVGFNIWRCLPDAMHCFDLGVYQNLAAACLSELVAEGVWPGHEHEAFRRAHLEYKEWCQTKNQPFCPRFESGRLCPGGTVFPHFTQQSAKGAMTKHLILWLADVLRDRLPAVDRHAQLRYIMFQNFARFEEVCEEHDRFLPVPARDIVCRSIETALECLNTLHAECLAVRQFVWQIVPKHHMLTHIAYDFAARGLNPRRVTCYADEDMVGKVKKIMSRCHGATAGRMVLERYAILIGTRWWVRLAQLRGLRDIPE